jgi:hypothetical protein
MNAEALCQALHFLEEHQAITTCFFHISKTFQQSKKHEETSFTQRLSFQFGIFWSLIFIDLDTIHAPPKSA